MGGLLHHEGVRPKHVAIGWIAAAIALGACSSEPKEPPLPSQPVEVLVDDLGISHLYAKDDRDAMWAAGYRMASERLYQMEMLKRFAHGRLAEVLGQEGLERDRLARAFDLPRWGRADREATRAADPERADLLHAWVRGINARVGEVRSGAVPPPFGFRKSERDFMPEPWTDDDPYIVLKGAGLALDKTIEFEIALTLLERTYPDAMRSVDVLLPAREVFSIPPEDRSPETKLADLPPSAPSSTPASGGKADRAAFAALARMLDAMPRASGSNNWAIAGSLSANGKPILAGDPHLSFDFFGAPYPLHINSKAAGGTFDVAGFAYPGTPGIALGHNDKVAWTATSAFADVTDVWEVKREGDGVRVGGAIAPIEARREKIEIRGEEPVEVDYEDVPGWGVVLPQDFLRLPIGGPFLVRWTGFTGRPARWFMELNRVQSLDEFDAAASRMNEMNYNFVAADASGIAYRVGVDVPLRGPIVNERRPWTVMSGADPEATWRGMLDRSKLPHGRANERRWIATANNDPFGFTRTGDVASAPFYYGAFFDPGYRAARISSELERLAAKGGITVDDMRALQQDTTSTLAVDLVGALASAHAKAKGAELDRLVTLLDEEWDKRMVRDAKGAFAFQVFLHHLMRATLKDDIELGYDFALKLQTVFIAKVVHLVILGKYPQGSALLDGKTADDVLLAAAKETTAWLTSRFGAVDATPLSARKVTSFDHALGYGVPLSSVATDGGEDTINVSQNISFSDDAPWVTTYVSVERTIASFGADGVPEAIVTFPFASNADPESAESKKANEDYVGGRYQKLPFRRGDVEGRTVRRDSIGAR